jgi:murein DD-endopeptidase MepM/ murein hydrolase activator NlpD
MAVISLTAAKQSPTSFGAAWRAASSLLDRVFVPREVILRASGQVSYLRLSSRAQKLAAAALCAAAAWGTFATASYVVHQETLAAKDGTIASQRSAYRVLEADFTRGLAEQARLEAEIAGLSLSLSREIAIGGDLTRQRTALQRQIGTLERRLARLRQAHEDVIARFSMLATTCTAAMESTIAVTGLDADALVSSIERTSLGQGDPLIPPREATAGLESSAALAVALSDLNERWRRLSALREAHRILPLNAPLSQYWISSGYGERKDPFTGETSHHSGVDLVAPLGTGIRATAPGRVVFAGKRQRYGRVIEIDHGHGIATRYAHLGKILVEAGQQVERGQKIGTLGNSGRSTGPHLHYEVRSGERDLNPVKFLEAGAHAIEG